MGWFGKKTVGVSINLRPEMRGAGGNLRFAEIALVLIAIAALGFSGYIYVQSRSANGTIDITQAKELTTKIGEIMLLPENETPTIATVLDPKVLLGQPFFAHAEVGDKVLVYEASKKAILYRPGAHKIIEVMPFILPPELSQ